MCLASSWRLIRNIAMPEPNTLTQRQIGVGYLRDILIAFFVFFFPFKFSTYFHNALSPNETAFFWNTLSFK